MSRRVAIVGAGLAGLAAARHLRRAGADVVVVERETAPGGRAASDAQGGFHLDAGPHRVGLGDRHLLGLVDGAGMADRLGPLRPQALAQLHGGALLPLDPGRVGRGRWPGVPPREARRLRRLARLTRRFRTLLDPARPEAAVRLDDRSAADFVRVYFGRHLLERGVDPLLRAELGADAEQTSRVALWLQLLARDALTTGTFRAGLGLLARALHDPAHDRLGARARAVEARGDGLALSVEEAAGTATLEVDAVLLATPARVALQVAAPLLRTPERDFLGAARSVPAVVLAAGLDRAPLRYATALRFPRVEGWPLAGALLEPGGAAARAPEGAALAMLVADAAWSQAHLEASEDGVSKALLEWLERLFPGAGSALRFARVRRYGHAWPRFDVGRYRALDRFARVQADLRAGGRRLYFAGDHLVAPTLEGAVVSGLRAARAIAEDLALRAG